VGAADPPDGALKAKYDNAALALASIVVDNALEKGRKLGFKPLTVAVLGLRHGCAGLVADG
jgi:hypothetical protein